MNKRAIADIQCVILAGGLGTRLAEHTHRIPKPLVEVGGMPLLWHIMKGYHYYGVSNFIICAGYKAEKINKFFNEYTFSQDDYKFEPSNGGAEALTSKSEDWTVTVVNTGKNSMTGGRLKRVKKYLKPNQPFFMTYGDGLSDVDINALYNQHLSTKTLVSVTAVPPPSRFGSLVIKDNRVTSFEEKPANTSDHINGGFFVMELDSLDAIDNDETSWEKEPLEALTKRGQLSAYTHKGFWQPVDNVRDLKSLEQKWLEGNAPWKTW